jgi:hypothetical protein
LQSNVCEIGCGKTHPNLPKAHSTALLPRTPPEEEKPEEGIPRLLSRVPKEKSISFRGEEIRVAASPAGQPVCPEMKTQSDRHYNILSFQLIFTVDSWSITIWPCP